MASPDAVAAGGFGVGYAFGVGAVAGALGVLVVLGLVFLIYKYLLPLFKNRSGLFIPGRRTEDRSENLYVSTPIVIGPGSLRVYP